MLFSVTANYTYVRARDAVNAVPQDVPLTPPHSAGLVGMLDAEDVGRVGIECYYTGEQSLEETQCRVTSEPYMILGLSAEKPFGRVRLFVNGENLTGVRQTRWDPCFSRRALSTAAGPSTRGRRSKVGTSTVAARSFLETRSQGSS